MKRKICCYFQLGQPEILTHSVSLSPPFFCRTKDKCDQISPLDLIDRADIETLTNLDGEPIVIGEGENGTTYLRSYQGKVVLEKMLTNKRGKIWK